MRLLAELRPFQSCQDPGGWRRSRRRRPRRTGFGPGASLRSAPATQAGPTCPPTIQLLFRPRGVISVRCPRPGRPHSWPGLDQERRIESSPRITGGQGHEDKQRLVGPRRPARRPRLRPERFHCDGNLDRCSSTTSNSPGTGHGERDVELRADTLTVTLAFAGLTSPTAIPAGVPGAAHIHFGLPGVEGPIIFPFIEPYANDFPLGVTIGFVVTILTAAVSFPTRRPASTRSPKRSARSRQDRPISTSTPWIFPGGKSRGQITVVPEPASLALLTLGLGGILAIARFRRRLAA